MNGTETRNFTNQKSNNKKNETCTYETADVNVCTQLARISKTYKYLLYFFIFLIPCINCYLFIYSVYIYIYLFFCNLFLSNKYCNLY